MLGVFIALVITVWKYFVLHQAPEIIFLSITNFLLWWFIITSAIILVICLISFILMTLGITIGGRELQGGALGGIAGFLGGSALSLIALIIVAICRGLLISGTYLIHHSLIINNNVPEWNLEKLILGIVLLFIGLIASKSSSSSSSSN